MKKINVGLYLGILIMGMHEYFHRDSLLFCTL